MSVCVIQFGAGRAGLQASVRGGDEAGHHIFVVYLKNQLPLYGEWRSKWTDGGYDFDVETVNFGYVNKENVGNRHADARCKLSFEERQITEQLVLVPPRFRRKAQSSWVWMVPAAFADQNLSIYQLVGGLLGCRPGHQTSIRPHSPTAAC